MPYHQTQERILDFLDGCERYQATVDHIASEIDRSIPTTLRLVQGIEDEGDCLVASIGPDKAQWVVTSIRPAPEKRKPTFEESILFFLMSKTTRQATVDDIAVYIKESIETTIHLVTRLEDEGKLKVEEIHSELGWHREQWLVTHACCISPRPANFHIDNSRRMQFGCTVCGAQRERGDNSLKVRLIRVNGTVFSDACLNCQKLLARQNKIEFVEVFEGQTGPREYQFHEHPILNDTDVIEELEAMYNDLQNGEFSFTDDKGEWLMRAIPYIVGILRTPRQND